MGPSEYHGFYAGRTVGEEGAWSPGGLPLKLTRNITVGVGVVVVQERRILTLRRIGGWWPGRLALVGGHPEEGETVHDAAAREVLEEVGLVVRPRVVNGHSLIFHTNEWISREPYKHHFSVYVVADIVGGTLENREPHKHRDIRFMTMDELDGVAAREELPLMPLDAISYHWFGICHG